MRRGRPWQGTRRQLGPLTAGLTLAAVLAAAAISLLAPLGAGAAPSTATLDLYVGCSTAPSAAPAHVCPLGEQPGAFLESTGELEYEVCVTFPSTNTLCPKPQVAKPGVLYVNPISTSQPGEHVVRWYVGGGEVASWSFVVEPAPVPPAPPVTPTPPAPPAEVEPAITRACGGARARTRRLQIQLRRTTGPRQRRRLRSRLRSARKTAGRACA